MKSKKPRSICPLCLWPVKRTHNRLQVRYQRKTTRVHRKCATAVLATYLIELDDERSPATVNDRNRF